MPFIKERHFFLVFSSNGLEVQDAAIASDISIPYECFKSLAAQFSIQPLLTLGSMHPLGTWKARCAAGFNLEQPRLCSTLVMHSTNGRSLSLYLCMCMYVYGMHVYGVCVCIFQIKPLKNDKNMMHISPLATAFFLHQTSSSTTQRSDHTCYTDTYTMLGLSTSYKGDPILRAILHSYHDLT